MLSNPGRGRRAWNDACGQQIACVGGVCSGQRYLMSIASTLARGCSDSHNAVNVAKSSDF